MIKRGDPFTPAVMQLALLPHIKLRHKLELRRQTGAFQANNVPTSANALGGISLGNAATPMISLRARKDHSLLCAGSAGRVQSEVGLNKRICQLSFGDRPDGGAGSALGHFTHSELDQNRPEV